MKSLTLCWLVLLLSFCYSRVLQASPNESALLAIAQDLHCAETERDSQVLLSQLMSIPTAPFGIPSDNFNEDGQYYLYAATVDILLQQLLETNQRFPNLQESIERTALLWNFCEIIAEGELVDLTSNLEQDVIKKLALKPFPAKEQGFSRWGFLNPDPENRYIPKILDLSLYPLAQQSLIFRLFVKQCFPHPDTGKLFIELKEPSRLGKLRMKKALPSGTSYPYEWKLDCDTDVEAEPIQEIIEPIVNAAVVVKPLLKIEPQVKLIEEVVIEAKTLEDFISEIKPVIKPKLNLQLYPKPKPSKIKKVDTFFKPYVEPSKNDIPIASTATASSGSNTGGILPLPKKDGYGFTGSLYHNSSLTGTLSVGATLSWTPHSYFFIRAGINYKYYPDDDVFSYSWGIGYDDWHPGTFSFQINNWGPILPKDGLAFDKAVVDIGYKFKADFLEKYNLNGSVSLVVPVTGDQQISTTWTWAPVEHWFIRVGFQVKPFAYDGVTWTYGFGYSDWHPFTVGLAYNNWGLNSLTNDSNDGVNFKENGLVTLSWSWAF